PTRATRFVQSAPGSETAAMTIGHAILGFLRILWRILDGFRKVLHLVLLLVLFVLILNAIGSTIPIVPHRAALLLNLQGRLVEQLSGDPLDRAFGRASGSEEAEVRLRDVL